MTSYLALVSAHAHALALARPRLRRRCSTASSLAPSSVVSCPPSYPPRPPSIERSANVPTREDERMHFASAHARALAPGKSPVTGTKNTSTRRQPPRIPPCGERTTCVGWFENADIIATDMGDLSAATSPPPVLLVADCECMLLAKHFGRHQALTLATASPS